MAVWHRTTLRSWAKATAKRIVVTWSVENCFCNRTSWKQAPGRPRRTPVRLRGRSVLSTKPVTSGGEHTVNWATRAHRSRKALAENSQLKILSPTHYPMLYLKGLGCYHQASSAINRGPKNFCFRENILFCSFQFRITKRPIKYRHYAVCCVLCFNILVFLS